MDPARVALLREVLAGTGWLSDARQLGRTMRRSTRAAGGLVLVGTPDYEPWHLTAHLDDEARLSGQTQLTPTLARWAVPDGAPPHLAVTLQRLEAAGRGETLLVVTPQEPPDSLLERASDARRRGATLLSVDGGDVRLGDLVHERMVVAPNGLALPESVVSDLGAVGAGPGRGAAAPAVPAGLSFDVAQHLVSAVAGHDEELGSGRSARRGWRARLDRVLDAVSGPAAQR